MNTIIPPDLDKKNTDIKKIDSPKTQQKYIYTHNFDIKFKTLLPVFKDIQMMSQLIQSIKTHQISDLIFISGNSSSFIDSRFYFNYRKIIDFYIRVSNIEENENFLKIKYHIYKTKPLCKNFFVDFSLIKSETSSKLEIEIFPPEDTLIIPENILNIIYYEFNNNFLYLFLSLKLQNEKLIKYESFIINNEFFVLSKIVQNIKLIEYLLGCKITKTNTQKNNIDNDYDKYIHLNEIIKIDLNKNKEQTTFNDIHFHITNFVSKEDRVVLKFKILSDKEISNENETNNSLNNVIKISVFKLTKTSCFVFHEIILDNKYEKNKCDLFIKSMKKFMNKIEKLSELIKKQYTF